MGILPDAPELRLVAIRREIRRDRRAVLRVGVALRGVGDALRDRIARRHNNDFLCVVLVVAHGQDELLDFAVVILERFACDGKFCAGRYRRFIEEVVKIIRQRDGHVPVGQENDSPERHVRVVRRELELRAFADDKISSGRTPDVKWRLDRVEHQRCACWNVERFNIEAAGADDDVGLVRCKRGRCRHPILRHNVVVLRRDVQAVARGGSIVSELKRPVGICRQCRGHLLVVAIHQACKLHVAFRV